MVNVVNACQLCHLVDAQQVEVLQQAKHQCGKHSAHTQGQSDACMVDKKGQDNTQDIAGSRRNAQSGLGQALR
jgi:hypothetical protein